MRWSSPRSAALLFAAVLLAPAPLLAQAFENLDGDELVPPQDEWVEETPGDLEPPTEPSDVAPEAVRETPAAPAAPAVQSSPDYALRLRELEDRVNELKEEIFRSKSRLVLLRERVLQTNIGGSQAIITHVNDMSATFDLEQVIYSLDGNQLYSALDEDGSVADQDRIEIYNGAIVPGPHNISVEMIFVGNGFGLFSYLEGYRFRLRSSYAFTTEDGKVTELDVIAYERGGVNQPIEERPDVRYELEFVDHVLDEPVALEE